METPGPHVEAAKVPEGKGLWSEEQETKFKAEADAIVSQAIEEAEAVPPPKIEDMFRYTFAEMTPTLKEDGRLPGFPANERWPRGIWLKPSIAV